MAARKPVENKCLGEGFTEDELKFFVDKRTICSKVDRIDGEATKDCFCRAYINPGIFWNRGGCPLADHYRPDLFVEKREFKRVGQQKQKKKK